MPLPFCLSEKSYVEIHLAENSIEVCQLHAGRAFRARTAFAALMYVLCISGTLLVLTDEMVRWDNPDTLAIVCNSETLAKAVDTGIAMAAEHGTNDYVVVSAPTPATPYINVQFVDFTTGFEKHYLATRFVSFLNVAKAFSIFSSICIFICICRGP